MDRLRDLPAGLPTAGELLMTLVLRATRSVNIAPRWSHDGRWVYYCSNRTGRLEIWRVRSEGGVSEQVTREGGFEIQESRDGKFLYFS